MGLEDWTMVEDADEDASQQRGGGGGGGGGGEGVEKKSSKTDDCVSKASKEQALLTSYQLGPFPLSHRIVHAPMTRCRAIGGVPQPATLIYYAQRATPGGLLVGEATHVQPAESEYPDTPGIFTQEQVDAWKPIVKAVHDKGAIFFLEIWHSGRSALSESEAQNLVKNFRIAARNARSAGFDGVEIHGAHGYLIGHELVRDRNDLKVDGSIQYNECRNALEIVKNVVEEIGAEHVGFRCSPYTQYAEVTGRDPVELGVRLAEGLNEHKILYAHLIESRGQIAEGFLDKRPTLESFRNAFKGHLIAAGGYTREAGNAAIVSGRADLIAYGRLFLSNPDLPKRFEIGAPLNKYDRGTFYSHKINGYIDYPTVEELEYEQSAL